VTSEGRIVIYTAKSKISFENEDHELMCYLKNVLLVRRHH